MSLDFLDPLDLADFSEPFNPLDPRDWAREAEEPSPIFLGRSGDRFAFVDPEVVPIVSRHVWTYSEDNRGKAYAKRWVTVGGVRSVIYLHRFIMLDVLRVLPPTEDHILVDHRNGEGLDCRKKNLRWTTVSENNANRRGYYFKRRPAHAYRTEARA